jgi:hypothetical protein
MYVIKWKTKQKYHTVRTVPKFNRNIVGTKAISIPLTQILDNSPSWLGTGNSIKCGGGKAIFMGAKLPFLVKWCGHFKHFPQEKKTIKRINIYI